MRGNRKRPANSKHPHVGHLSCSPRDTNTARLNCSRHADDPDQLFASLDALGIAAYNRQAPAGVHGRAGARLRGQIAGGHTKNLFLRDKKYELYLVVALEDAEIDLKGLHRQLGATGRFSFGSSDLLREVLGRRARRGDAVRRHQRHAKAASPWCSTPP